MSYPATYLRPESLTETLRLAADPANVILAGGTILQPQMNEDRLSPRAVLDISAVPELQGISAEDGQIRIGATATLAEIAAHPEVHRLAPILVHAVESIACPEVRRQATLGGNIEAGLPSMDSLPALLVLDARVELASATGRRRIALGAHMIAGRTTRKADELLLAVEFTPQAQWAGQFLKLGVRKAFAPSILSVAILLRMQHGTVGELRIAAGGCADRALRLTGVEAAAAGRQLDGATVDQLATLAASQVSPYDDLYRTAAYRRHALEELLRRTLRELASAN
jgi:CO/xanthine dehydrogenase FAD-binding subunit